MTVRLDQLAGIKADMHEWFWEADDDFYTKNSLVYRDIAEVGDIGKIKGGYWQTTSNIGAAVLEDRDSGGQYSEDMPTQGFTVYALIKDKALKIHIPREMQRDWWRTEDWLKDYVKKNWPMAVEETKDDLVIRVYDKGGLTAGDTIFDNDSAEIDLETYTTADLIYDGAPFLTRTGGTNHVNKVGTSYFNALASGAGPTAAQAEAMYNRLTVTIAKKENDRPFNNKNGIKVFSHADNDLAWDKVINSTLYPDNGENAKNALASRLTKVVSTNKLATSNFSCLTRGKGVKAWFNEPKFNFFVKDDPEEYWATVVMDYAICVQNYRDTVSDNAPAS